MRRIGIMGGTFNPIHNGHLAIAEKAREQFTLKKVLFMPSGVPYMKEQREVLPIQARCEMAALAIKDMPGFELSRMETVDAAQGKNTYTCDTLQKLRAKDPEAAYYFILGADSLYAMEKWKNPAYIFQNCTILAAVRRISPMSPQAMRVDTKTETCLIWTTRNGLRSNDRDGQQWAGSTGAVSAGKIPCVRRNSGICRYGHILHTDSGNGAKRRVPAGAFAGSGGGVYPAEASL